MLQEQLAQLKNKSHIEHLQLTRPNTYRVTYSPVQTNSPYSHLVYSIKLIITPQYPQQAPNLFFIDKIYHLNVHPSTGEVKMALLQEDWSPFLTLSAVFDSLDQLMEEPDPNFAATPELQQEYMVAPEKYAQKLIRVSSGEVNYHKEEDLEVSPRTVHKILNNVDSEEMLKGLKDVVHSPDPHDIIEEAGAQKEEDRAEEKQQRVAGVQNGLVRQINNQPRLDPRRSPQALAKTGSPERVGSHRKLPATESYVMDYEDHGFLEMSSNLHKAEQFLEVLMIGYDSMEKTLKNTQNKRIKELLEQKLSKQWDMVSEVVDLTTKLKEKLFTSLSQDAKKLLA